MFPAAGEMWTTKVRTSRGSVEGGGKRRGIDTTRQKNVPYERKIFNRSAAPTARCKYRNARNWRRRILRVSFSPPTASWVCSLCNQYSSSRPCIATQPPTSYLFKHERSLYRITSSCVKKKYSSSLQFESTRHRIKGKIVIFFHANLRRDIRHPGHDLSLSRYCFHKLMSSNRRNEEATKRRMSEINFVESLHVSHKKCEYLWKNKEM